MTPALPLPDDHALVEAFRAGDEFAFVALYNRHKGGVYAFAARMLLSREAAQDVLQETFVRVYEHRQRLVSAGSFRAWLYAIARNQCLHAIRRAAREGALSPDVPEPPAEGTPFTDLLRSEQADLVTRYLARLSPPYREVLVLREYQHLSYDEIAAVTRTTVSSVKSRLFKARRALGEHLQPWLGPAPDSVPRPVEEANRASLCAEDAGLDEASADSPADFSDPALWGSPS